ncbi:MAG TPA: endonuclease III [candidate division WOR-3 bacterium]|uniref:Endonuclease III n=1 Tax=candidate division WOR-3 bacterium TaxID=2052148 RepID=A0A7C0VBP4_UNCW3|nr:endonuclease III [candidate division WOR-3 bacterium]
MDNRTIEKVLKIMEKRYVEFKDPIVTEIAERTRDPFRILISTILSLRTKDEVTAEASKRLFQVADTPEKILNLKTNRIERLIYPVGFYKTKAKRLKQVCRILVEEYNGRVPDSLDELLRLPGVGRKTANLVITLGYGKPGICVDTHVHRISNRLGYVDTKTPEQTEMELRKKLPPRWWIKYNDLLVTWGQNICTPISPRCSICPVAKYCEKKGVKKSR